MMKTLHIADIDLDVSVLCYGAMAFGTQMTGEAVDALFDAFLAGGGNFFDTAHCYRFWVENGLGTSERGLGDYLRRRGIRDRVVVATKGGHPAGGPAYPRPDYYISPQTVTGDIDDSLSRMGIDHIDLYYLHRDDARVPVGEIIDLLNAEIARGRIRALGASNWRITRIEEANAYAAAHGLHGFVVSQPQFSLAQSNMQMGEDPSMRTLTPEDIRWHRATQLPVAAYSPTACGYFAGREVKGYANEVSQARRERARQLADTLGCTPNQVALAYLLHQDFPVIPIIGTTDPAHLADALGAVEVALTAEQVRWLEG